MMTTHERHLTTRKLRSTCLTTSKDMFQVSKTEARRSSCRSARKAKTMRAHHQPTAVRKETNKGRKMERVERSLRELAQLLGLQTVGVDEASLLETTVAFLRSSQDEHDTHEVTRRGGRHGSDLSQDTDAPNTQSQQSEDSSPTDAILAGFQDCMEETIRYLVDVEGFSPNDEVVVGLTAHLLQVRAKLDINNDSTATSTWSSPSSDGDGLTECEATTSTQTSPQESNTLSLALASEHRQSSSETNTSRTLPDRILPRGLPPSHYMTPLTVDTNQYYALPSPLNRTAMACAMKPSEPLLMVAKSRSTHMSSTYSTAAAVASVAGRPLTATASSFQRRSAATVTSLQQQYQSVLPANGCLIPCVSAAPSEQRPYGFNLNYVAPYVVAWVRPVQE